MTLSGGKVSPRKIERLAYGLKFKKEKNNETS